MAVAVRNYPQIECEIVTEFSRLESIASEWQALWSGSEHSEVFQHFGWSRACWKAFESELSLLTPLVYRGDELIGILPLAVNQGTLQFITSPLSDYNDVICREEDTAEVMNAAVQSLLRSSAEWATCVMENVPSHARIMRYLSENPPFSRHFHTAFRSPCPAAILSEDGTAATKLAGKQSLRRHENHLKKQGHLTFKHLELREDIDQHLELMFEQHIARRAIAGGESHFLDPQVRTLFQELAHELDPRSVLRFSVLSLDDKPVAYHFGFERARKLVIYQLAFDVDYWKSSPGEVLFRYLLFYVRDHKLTELDFTRGGEIYKDRFANEVRANFTVHFNHDLGLRRRVRTALKQANGAARRFMEILRKYPPAYRIARNSALRFLNVWRTCKQLKDGTNVGMARVLRTAIFDKTVTCTFIAPKQELGKHMQAQTPNVGVRPVLLSEVAMISALRPDLRLPIADIHDRIASGQQIYVLRNGTEPAEMWSTRIEQLSATNDRLPKTEERLVCEQFWSSSRNRAGGGLDSIVPLISGSGMGVLISCNDNNPIFEELCSAGFRLARRIIHLRILHWFRPAFELRVSS